MGLIGARAEYLLKCRESTFAAEIAAEEPDLVILGYGTNESSGSNLDEDSYASTLSTIISRIRRAAPSALIVILTPPDRGDSRPEEAQHIQRMLHQVIAAQRAAAWNADAVLLDLNTAMGGPGSVEHWAAANPPLARSDLTHFTNEGYNLLGRYIAGGIMKLYDVGPEAIESSTFAGSTHTAELLPPLYSGMNGAAALRPAAHTEIAENPAPSQIIYFLRKDGQVIVTNDLASVDGQAGRLISAEEAGCRLRRKALPCDNTARW